MRQRLPFFLFFLITLCFVLTAFLAYDKFNNTTFFYTFYEHISDYIFLYPLFSFFLFLSLIIIFFIYLSANHYSFIKTSFLSVIHTITITIGGLFFAYVFLLILAVIELNIFSIILSINPKFLGVKEGQSLIINQLKSFQQFSQIITADEDSRSVVKAIAIASSGKENFYGKALLPSLPNYLIINKKINKGIFMIDNTFIITTLDHKMIEELSPYIAYMLIKKTFPTRYIKYYPKVNVLNQIEYQRYRTIASSEKLIKINDYIKDVENKITSISAIVKDNQALLTAKQNEVRQLSVDKTLNYQFCKKNNFSASVSACLNNLNSWDKIIRENNNLINNLKKEIQQDQKQLNLYNSYYNYLLAYQAALKQKRISIPHELGIFEPKDTIKIVLNTTSATVLADYFAVLIHEYLHYASYPTDEKKLSSSFFEEGLTEYFARKTLENSLQTTTNIGYPVVVKIIKEMTKVIPESEFADIYFSKDQKKLEEAIDRVYGDKFYHTNVALFESLQYTTNPNQTLKLANDIMKRIGGKPLKAEDLVSTLSIFH